MKTVIVSLSAKNIHKSLAAWCLKAYCEKNGLQGIQIIESDINVPTAEIIRSIHEKKPDNIAFSCYIWNIELVNKLCGLLKKVLPNSLIILGGPEVSFENNPDSFPLADYVVKGAGEEAFFNLLCALKSDSKLYESKFIDGKHCGFNGYPTPYTEDYFQSFEKNNIPISNQLIYYESSRGCKYSCAYCLSSVEKEVSYSQLQKVKDDIMLLISRGAKCIKFVDRTFNSDLIRAKEILQFILQLDTVCTFHFEVAADLFDEQLMQVIGQIPKGRVQFEIGIQSVNATVLNSSSRRTNTEAALKNIQKLVSFGNCHIHVDLIAGLPHESIESFKESIDRCIAVRPHMLQLGFLKMLKGTKMRRDAASFGAVFADFAPYEVYQTDTMSCEDFFELKKIEKIIDKFYNTGAFENCINFAIDKSFGSAYAFFKKLSDFCPDAHNLKVSLKSAYSTLLNFLRQYTDNKEAEHYVKLDCLAQDSGRSLPDGIIHLRDKAAENAYRKKTGDKSANIRIEFFEYSNKLILYDYSKKNALKNRFEMKEI